MRFKIALQFVSFYRKLSLKYLTNGAVSALQHMVAIICAVATWEKVSTRTQEPSAPVPFIIPTKITDTWFSMHFFWKDECSVIIIDFWTVRVRQQKVRPGQLI